MANYRKYVNKEFVFINGDFNGEHTRCTGVFTSENDGITYLELTNGMPVPVDQVDYFLKETKPFVTGADLSLDEFKAESAKLYSENGLKQGNAVNSSGDKNNGAQNERFAGTDTVQAAIEKPVDMFGGFSKNPMELTLKLNVELPDIALIRVMYNNYGNKEEFISNFASHILASINKDVISESVIALLEGNGKAKRVKKTASAPVQQEETPPEDNNGQ